MQSNRSMCILISVEREPFSEDFFCDEPKNDFKEKNADKRL
jgi:hypothetical protein